MSFLTRQSSTDSNYSLCPSISDISMSEEEPNTRRHQRQRQQQQQQQQRQQQRQQHDIQQQQLQQQQQQQQQLQQQQQNPEMPAITTTTATPAVAARWRRNNTSPPLEYSDTSEDNNNNHSNQQKNKNRSGRSSKKALQQVPSLPQFKSVSKFRRRSQQSHIIQFGTIPSDMYLSDDDDEEEEEEEDDAGREGGDEGNGAGDDDDDDDDDEDEDDNQENKQHRRNRAAAKKLPSRPDPQAPVVSLPTTGAATPTPLTAADIPKQPPGQEQQEQHAPVYSSIPSLNQLMSTVAYSFHRGTPPQVSPSQRKQPPNRALLSLGLEGLSQKQQPPPSHQHQPQSQPLTQLPNESSGEMTEYPHYDTTSDITLPSTLQHRKPHGPHPSSSSSFPTWSTSGDASAPTSSVTNEKSPLLMHRHKIQPPHPSSTASGRPNPPTTTPFSISTTKITGTSSLLPTGRATLKSSSSSKWNKQDRPLLRRGSGQGIGPDSSASSVGITARQRNMLSQRRFQIAACYLIDYESGRPPTLPPSILTLLALPFYKHLPQHPQQPPLPSQGEVVTATARAMQAILHWHSWQYSWIWRNLVSLAAFILLVSSSFETTSTVLSNDDNFHTTVIEHVALATLLNLVAVAILGMDLYMQRQLRGEGLPSSSSPITKTTVTASALSMPDAMATKTMEPSAVKGSNQAVGSITTPSIGFDPEASPPTMHQRQRCSKISQQQPLALPLSIFLVVLALESIQTLIIALLWTTTDSPAISPQMPQRPWFASIFKPLVFFYISTKARQALEALVRILPIALRVVAMELFVILAFSAVACRLYHTFESFATLPMAWLSLYELSTTVVNPSLWMPLYESSKISALFFIFFVVISVFYMHSLVLSVVFQIYVQAAADVHERSITDREYTLRLAFSALQQSPQRSKLRPGGPASGENDNDDDDDLEEDLKRSTTVDMASVRQTLRFVRPHYNAMKINTLVEIVDPSNQQVIDYPTFRNKIRQALNASVRTPRATTPISLTVELLAVMVAVSNFIYVILLTSSFQAKWFDWMTLPGGMIITLLGLLELIVRFNPLRNVTPITRLEGTFDGLALVAALVSIVGVVLFLTGQNNSEALEYILMGRALDMMRIMRFLKMFRDVVRRSADVIPALTGPVILVITALHLFTYTGMALWGGAVKVGEHEGEIEPLYDLNNFNSYEEGMVTMFQILVNNDWHAIAKVFLFATRCSSPYIVYPFFVGGQIMGGCILLNVVTAFFVESFIAKLGYSGPDSNQERMSIQRDRDDDLRRSTLRRKTSMSGRWSDTMKKTESKDEDDDGVASQESTDHNEVFEFDVYEREGYDQIMRTVTGVQQEDLAHQVCKYLEIFESLAPGRDKVGYLVCCQQTMSRFGNRRFQTMAGDYVEDNVLHGVVTDMHTELLVLSSGMKGASFVESEKSLIRTFPHRTQPAKKMLEVSASLLRNHPAVSLFVSRVIRFKPPTHTSGTSLLTAGASAR